MIDFAYLDRGLDGLSNAHRGGSMAGHAGAALIAGYCFAENNPDLDPAVYEAIERDLDRILNGEEEFWIDRKSGLKTADLFVAAPSVKADWEVAQKSLVESVQGQADRMRESGHNMIFVSTALRAFSDHPELASASRISGVVKLIRLFDRSGPGRGYFGNDEGWKKVGEKGLEWPREAPAVASVESMAEAVIDDLIAFASEHRQGFGGLFHLIDHAASLVELDRHGFSGPALAGCAALGQHRHLLRALPVLDDELGVLEKAESDPRQPDYWSRRSSKQWSGWLTHRIKVLYGLDILLPLIESPEKRLRAEAAFRYLMA
jgi:hypothetical protein